VASDLSSDILEDLTEGAKEAVAEAGQEAIAELVTDGLNEDEAKALVVQLLDGVLAWKLFLAEPLASILEAGDGPAISLAIEKVLPALQEALKSDPDKIETRAATAEERGHPKIAARRRARAARVRARQES
jgi:hypothetical protein